MFLKSHDIELLKTKMPDTTISWKEFEESVVLIAIASGTTSSVLEKFLQVVFDSMVLIVGIEEIKNPRNIERLKRELRGCNNIIDKLLECLDIGDKISTKSDFIDLNDSILCTENCLLQVENFFLFHFFLRKSLNYKINLKYFSGLFGFLHGTFGLDLRLFINPRLHSSGDGKLVVVRSHREKIVNTVNLSRK